MAKIQNGNGAAEEEWPEYQPLVENTKPRERKDSLPGYQVMSIAQKPNQQPTSNRDIRLSNYLSLVKDDLEEGQQYQTLVKDQNPQVRLKGCYRCIKQQNTDDSSRFKSNRVDFILLFKVSRKSTSTTRQTSNFSTHPVRLLSLFF